MTLSFAVFLALSVLAVGGAVVCVLVRETVRVVAGLGTFLVAVAGLFLYYGMPFLAAAEVFVYVGGVLVLFLFALMLVSRTPEGRGGLSTRHDIGSAAVAAGVFLLLAFGLGGGVKGLDLPKSAGPGVDMLGKTLLGPMLPAFEMVGVLLLISLVAALVIAARGEEE